MPVSFTDIEPELGHKGIGGGELGEGEYRHRELADAYDSDAELGDGNDSAADCPMAITPFATTGTRLGRYLKEMCTRGRPSRAALDLYSKPHPSHFSLDGNGAPHCGQTGACSETG